MKLVVGVALVPEANVEKLEPMTTVCTVLQNCR